MRYATTMKFALLITNALIVGGCAATKGQTQARSTGSFIDDSRIESLVRREIRRADPGLKHAHVSVVSYNGVVLVLGQVDNERLKLKATQAATKIRKATKVHNEMEISGPISRVARTNDTWLTSKVKTRLVARRDIRGGRIKVVTENSVVYLMGLTTRDHADKAVEVARNVFGVQKIVKVFEYTS